METQSPNPALAMEIAKYLVIIRAKFPFIACADIILPTNGFNPLAETTLSFKNLDNRI